MEICLEDETQDSIKAFLFEDSNSTEDLRSFYNDGVNSQEFKVVNIQASHPE